MNAYVTILPVLGFVIASACRARGEVVKDQETLVGKWVVVSAELGGKASESSKGDTFTFGKEKVTINNKVKESEVPYTLDQTKDPKQIDFQDTDTSTSKGIYELKGDNLRLCYGGERPADFKSGPGTLMLVLMREVVNTKRVR